MKYEFFVSCAKGAENVLTDEMRALGISKLRPLNSGVSFNGTLPEAYRCLLWLRTASRVLLVLARVDATDSDTLYNSVLGIAWEEHVACTGSIAVDARGTNEALRDSQFIAVRIKDAVCDRLREKKGERPRVDREKPDVRINVRLRNASATIALDLAGEPLHRRGYRMSSSAIVAPLRETLAATMLLASGALGETGIGNAGERKDAEIARTARKADDAVAASTGARTLILDPLCGSGTLVIEAALMLGDLAPGILRSYWGFEGWLKHEPELWSACIDEADSRAEAAQEQRIQNTLIHGSDSDPAAVEVARESARKAGVAHAVSFSCADIAQIDFTNLNISRLLVACNPPYAERLSTASQLPALYSALDALLQKAVAQGIKTELCIISPYPNLDAVLSRAPKTVINTYNGPLKTTIRNYTTDTGVVVGIKEKSRATTALAASSGDTQPQQQAVLESTLKNTPDAAMTAQANLEALIAQYPQASQFAARLQKMYTHKKKWARKAGVSCYRVYDADLPDYAAAIDLYTSADTGTLWLQIAEYAAPKNIDVALAARRLKEILVLAPAILNVPTTNVFLKQRRQAKGGAQYSEQRPATPCVQIVEEGKLLFEVEFATHLDTGLFLDHRMTRDFLRDYAKNVDALNLFGYTGSASVYMAKGGARSVTTVDLSNTYLAWAERNMRRNGFVGKEHTYVAADVVRWVQERRRGKERYGLVFVDPPTFSNSTEMGKRTWDVQRDHVELLIGVSRLLTPQGTAVFSTNLRSFKPDFEALAKAQVRLTDISARTIPSDFERNPRIHRCYLLEYNKAPRM